MFERINSYIKRKSAREWRRITLSAIGLLLFVGFGIIALHSYDSTGLLSCSRVCIDGSMHQEMQDLWKKDKESFAFFGGAIVLLIFLLSGPQWLSNSLIKRQQNLDRFRGVLRHRNQHNKNGNR